MLRVAGLDTPIPFAGFEKFILPGKDDRARREAGAGMSENIILPKWGLTMEEGTVTAWRKQAAMRWPVANAADVETDKSTTNCPPISGISPHPPRRWRRSAPRWLSSRLMRKRRRRSAAN